MATTLASYRKRLSAGQRFGMLVVEAPAVLIKNRQSVALCVCDCGNKKMVAAGSLRRHLTSSCGCLRRKVTASTMTTHGKSKTVEYKIWIGIIQRCCDPKCHAFKDYGGRGITMHPPWRESFEQFLQDVGVRPGKGRQFTLDRIDNNDGYRPGNVRWATQSQQCRNTRVNRILEWAGEKRCASDWADICGISLHTILARIDRYNWPISEALTRPVRGQSKWNYI